MFGLGKPSSKFKKFLINHDISQEDLSRSSGVNRNTISRLCQGDSFKPSMTNGQKLLKSLRKLTNKQVDYDDFWSM